MSSSDTSTVILGSGIIGLSTAYYLSESGCTDPKKIHLVDASPELFRCASGLAGGFLAADCTFALGWTLRVRSTSKTDYIQRVCALRSTARRPVVQTPRPTRRFTQWPRNVGLLA
jgi:glycine/D-amino acid oxidase-like deaminating enzyme